MNILLDEMPCHIEICGKKYPVNTDFRVWMRFEELLLSEEAEKAFAKAIILCLKPERNFKNELPPSFKETIKALCDFYFCRTGEENARKSSSGGGKRVYSFTHDANLIYAAFMQQYGIDLTKCDLHWWAFRELFSALSGNAKICSVMRIRAMDLTDVAKGAPRNRLAKLKAIYALPDFKSDEEREAELAEALW